MKKILASLSLTALIAGCALPSSNYKGDRLIDSVPKDHFVVYSAYKANFKGVISWSDKDHCDANKFVKYVMDSKTAHNVINIVMDESCNSQTQNASCTCSYSGYGLVYTPIDANEAILWRKSLGQDVQVEEGASQSSGQSASNSTSKQGEDQNGFSLFQ